MEQREGFEDALTGGCWLWKAGETITGNGVSYLFFVVFFFFFCFSEEYFWLSPVGPKFEDSVGNLSGIDQILTIWGQLLQKLWFGFWYQLLRL